VVVEGHEDCVEAREISPDVADSAVEVHLEEPPTGRVDLRFHGNPERAPIEGKEAPIAYEHQSARLEGRSWVIPLSDHGRAEPEG